MSRNHPRLISQIVVLVSITGLDRKAQVSYTYTDPETGLLHVEATGCSLNAHAPYHTVYALDYAATRNGWCFKKKIKPRNGSNTIPHYRADNRLLMVTEYDELDTEYHFYLLFRNKVTGKSIHDDPQEGNITTPK
ncbi:hypothetical protein ACFDR9_005098 [Janthinobacterium sp. CG_23.3]|uniref:hypothetical protein n=1 Tax=Janthinobacterium sp. CG_23.3 TaxID=3349634 RepID=UPI0038D36871